MLITPRARFLSSVIHHTVCHRFRERCSLLCRSWSVYESTYDPSISSKGSRLEPRWLYLYSTTNETRTLLAPFTMLAPSVTFSIDTTVTFRSRTSYRSRTDHLGKQVGSCPSSQGRTIEGTYQLSVPVIERIVRDPAKPDCADIVRPS
jgi:hypothetical protein